MKFINIIILLVLLGCSSKSTQTYTWLNLGDKDLKEIPDSILEMKSLRHLNLGPNGFTIYPPLGGITIGLGDHANKINKLPKEITNLNNLRFLRISANLLDNLPQGFHKLENLDTLLLDYNVNLELANVIFELEQMKGLKYLDITGIQADQDVIENLKKSLPRTKIISRLDEIEIVEDTLE